MMVCILNRIALIRVLRWESRFHDTQASVQGASQRPRQAGPTRGQETRQQGETGSKTGCEKIHRHSKGDHEAKQEGGAETCEEASDQSDGQACGKAKREACGQASEQASGKAGPKASAQGCSPCQGEARCQTRA